MKFRDFGHAEHSALLRGCRLRGNDGFKSIIPAKRFSAPSRDPCPDMEDRALRVQTNRNGSRIALRDSGMTIWSGSLMGSRLRVRIFRTPCLLILTRLKPVSKDACLF